MTKKTLVIFALEPLENRYTKQWITHLPKVFGTHFDVIQIEGNTRSDTTTPGAFLDFAATNQWKNEQFQKFMDLEKSGQIPKDAVLLFADAWNPVILEVAYVRDLLLKNWKLAGMWHAGSYDPYDLLGQADLKWGLQAESAFASALNMNFFATQFHKNLFEGKVLTNGKNIVCGFPFEYLEDPELFPKVEKKNIVLFPHRPSMEKNYDTFKRLERELDESGWEFVTCKGLTKSEYHELLARSKIVWSGSKQETLGISIYEGLRAGCAISVPNSLSYAEMYSRNWFNTSSDGYHEFDRMKRHLKDLMDVFDELETDIRAELLRVSKYFRSEEMLYYLLRA